MTAVVFDSGAKPNLPMKVKNTTLLGIMMIAPLMALLAIIDKPLLGGVILENMITNPRDIAFWTAVLTVPHIVASLVTFADREYLSHHKKNLTKAVVYGLLLAFAAPFIVGFVMTIFFDIPAQTFEEFIATGSISTLVIMAFYTMYHNLMQQYGLSLMMLRQGPTFDFQMWRWFTILPAGLAYIMLMLSDAPDIRQIWDVLVAIIGTGLFIATVFGFRFIRTILKNPDHTQIGLWYFVANMASLYICFGLIVSGYGFMAMLVPRLTHDFTAFWIYMVHDENRNAERARNPVYMLPKKLGIHPWMLCAPIAILISSFLMGVAENLLLVTMFVTALNYIHYYIEGYMWKRGQPHRQHVPFV